MSQRLFEKRYDGDWQTLEAILDNKIRDSDSTSASLPTLYRRACHQLAIAKHRRYSSQLIARLNQIVLKGHHRLYQYSPRFQTRWLRFFAYDFPRSIRSNIKYVWAAVALFYLPLFILGFACYLNGDLIYSAVDPEFVAQFEQMYNEDAEKFGRERASDTDWLMFGHYIQNNIGIAFRTFAGGILFGIGSIFFLIYNGLFIGAIAGYVAQIGYGQTFFSFVIGHGAFELTAIVFSGAAGLKLGFSLVDPGEYRRLVALKLAAKEAIVIVYGATLMLIIAAVLEAFWSSSSIVPVDVKFAVGAVFWLLVIWYCSFGGRAERYGS